MSNYFDRFLEAYKQTSFEFGVADIFIDDSVGVAERVGSFGLLMNQATLGKGGDHVRGVLVIAPPTMSKLGCDQPEIEATTRTAAEVLFKREITKQEQGALSRFVRVVHAESFRVSAVLEVLKSAVEGSAAIVLFAALYGLDGDFSAPPLPSPVVPDDLWVPHLCELAARAVEIAKAQKCYLLLDTGEPSPQRPENYERMKGIKGCGLFGVYSTHDAGNLIADNIANWRSLAESGRLGSLFRSIDALPPWMNSQKSFLKLQLVEAVVPPEEILRLLRDEEPNIRMNADSRARLKLARMAQRCNHDQFSLELLNSAIDGLHSAEDYLLAADLADDLAEFSLLDRILNTAHHLFPQSPSFLDQRLKFYLRNATVGEVVRLLLDAGGLIDPRLKFFFLTLGSAFASGAPVDFDLLIQTVSSATPEFTNWCRSVCANEAIQRHEFVTAVELCMPKDGRLVTASDANVIVTALKCRLLQRASDGRALVVRAEDMIAPVQAVIDYLSKNPRDAATRQRLTTLLSVETSGLLGLTVLVAITSRPSRNAGAVEINTSPPAAVPVHDPDACLAVVKEIMKWAANESPLVPGRTRIPKDLLTEPPDEVLTLVKETLKHPADLRADIEERAFDGIMAVGLLVAPHSTTPNDDLDLLRYAAARYVAANKPQRARDLAEQALQTAAGTPDRNRTAWIAFADIYHRARSFNEALLGIACALQIKVPIDFAELHYEASLLIRIYRDIHLLSPAKEAANRLVDLCVELDLDDAFAQRVGTLLLQIRMMEALHDPARLKCELPTLMQDAAKHCVDLAEQGEDILPATLILAQCLQQAKAAGIEVPDDIEHVLDTQLHKVPGPVADLVKLLDPTATTGEELFTLAKSIQPARNAEDTGFDFTMLGIAARRFLDSPMDSGDPAIVTFTLEALTDHALNDALIGTEQSPFHEMNRSLAMAEALSRRGIDIVMLGLSEKGTLVRLFVVNGIAQAHKESQEVFSGEKFQKWTQTYPYGYSLVNDPMNLFYVTLEGIGVSLTPQGPTLLIMDNSLQQMPPNLIMADKDFAGRRAPMAAAPSLSWVSGVQSRNFHVSKKIAWISTEFAEDRNPALITLAERLQETFETYGITLHTSATIPEDLAESELAIIAAHGGILPEGRFIQRISDDAAMAIYPAALANAVRGTAVVVLFICSGGRLDSHPVAEMTVGLVRQLLDQGCATVIASPWPLDTRVPSHWLPVFLQRWTAGDSAIEATFIANQNVMKHMGDSPLDSLAMNVFGDPLRKKSVPE